MLRRTLSPARFNLSSFAKSALQSLEPDSVRTTGPRGAALFEHWGLQQRDMRDPVSRALLAAGAYVDQRVAWLPYRADYLAAQSQHTLGVPLRMSCITATEPVPAGVMLACLPLDVCVSPGFVAQTPSLLRCFEHIADEYSDTVGDATFVLSHDAVCSIVLLSFAITTEGAFQDYYTAIMDVEKIEGRWALTDVTSTTGDGDEPDALHATGGAGAAVGGGGGPQLNEFMRQLCRALPTENDTWRYYGDLCVARTKTVQKLYADVYDRKDSVFYQGCSFDDFCASVALYQARSAPMPACIQRGMQCEVGLLPFYDCADHRFHGFASEEEEQAATRAAQQALPSGIGEIATAGDMLSVRIFKEQGQKFSAESAPAFLPPTCRAKPSIGIFATRDIEVGEPITRCFGAESRGVPSEQNLNWMINHSSVPWHRQAEA